MCNSNKQRVNTGTHQHRSNQTRWPLWRHVQPQASPTAVRDPIYPARPGHSTAVWRFNQELTTAGTNDARPRHIKHWWRHLHTDVHVTATRGVTSPRPEVWRRWCSSCDSYCPGSKFVRTWGACRSNQVDLVPGQVDRAGHRCRTLVSLMTRWPDSAVRVAVSCGHQKTWPAWCD